MSFRIVMISGLPTVWRWNERTQGLTRWEDPMSGHATPYIVFQQWQFLRKQNFYFPTHWSLQMSKIRHTVSPVLEINFCLSWTQSTTLRKFPNMHGVKRVLCRKVRSSLVLSKFPTLALTSGFVNFSFPMLRNPRWIDCVTTAVWRGCWGRFSYGTVISLGQIQTADVRQESHPPPPIPKD
jgi:hypothetical protein